MELGSMSTMLDFYVSHIEVMLTEAEENQDKLAMFTH